MESKAAHTMYYLAILCPPDLDKEIWQFKSFMKERYGCRVALKSPAHITLLAPFWFDETKEHVLRRALELFSADLDNADIHLKDFSHFNKKVLFVKVEANPMLEKLKIQAERHFIQVVANTIKKDERPFHPHITVSTRDLKPGDFVKAWEHFSKKTFMDSFVATKISLLKLVSGKWNVIGEKNWKTP